MELSVVFLGASGSGKSTVAGHLLWELKALDSRALAKAERDAQERHKDPQLKYAWVSQDGLSRTTL